LPKVGVPSSLLNCVEAKERLVAVVVTRISDDRVVVAVDPHKASWTAAAVDGSLRPLATVRVPVSRDGYRALRRFAHRWPHARWAIEGAAGVGAPLTTLLRTDGIEVLDVPAKLAARVRVHAPISPHGDEFDLMGSAA
jgi:transposase